MNWSGWITMTHEEQAALRKHYRDEIKRESDAARDSKYWALELALRTGVVPPGRRGESAA